MLTRNLTRDDWQVLYLAFADFLIHNGEPIRNVDTAWREFKRYLEHYASGEMKYENTKENKDAKGKSKRARNCKDKARS